MRHDDDDDDDDSKFIGHLSTPENGSIGERMRWE